MPGLGAVLRIHGRHRGARLRQHRSGLRDGQVGRWDLVHGMMNPGLVMRNIIPVVMAGVLGIYGLIVAVIIQGSIVAPQNGLSQSA
ncbi:hypothetical protein THAOC_22810, partial [Thalassiosira oceanica]